MQVPPSASLLVVSGHTVPDQVTLLKLVVPVTVAPVRSACLKLAPNR